jgi:hypothetical protein
VQWFFLSAGWKKQPTKEYTLFEQEQENPLFEK